MKLGWHVGVGARLTDKPMKLYIIFLDMEHKNVFSFHNVPLKHVFRYKVNVELSPHMPSLIKTPSRPHRLPCRSPPPARKLPPTP